MLENLLSDIVAIALQAGQAIMDIYAAPDSETITKEDGSPLTRADLAADLAISKGLENLGLNWPVLSEESAQAAYTERQSWQSFWLIDPLDGTKEFIRRNGEFTVNIALIENGEPVLGVVYAPALDLCYFAARGVGAFVKRGQLEAQRINVQPLRPGEAVKLVVSRSHSDERINVLLQKLGDCECVSMGSSLKLCLVAEGAAHVYPRLGPTMEWDTAAAHVVVNQAGGCVCDLQGAELRYNKIDLHNPDFFVLPANDKDLCDKLGILANTSSILNISPVISPGVVWHHATVTRIRREALNKHRGAIIWFTGLSGSGKSTLAHAVEEVLHQKGCRTFVLDGDNVRHGLCGDLGFSTEDRNENIRRVGEMAKLFMEAGIIVLTAFISPYRDDRERVRGMVEGGDFIEIFCDANIDICERRDVKGLYKKARAGQIRNFTGISSPYEVPIAPELALKTGVTKLDACIQQVIDDLQQRGILI
jgi:3'(2'),5'-bisphosphate nucleotidase